MAISAGSTANTRVANCRAPCAAVVELRVTLAARWQVGPACTGAARQRLNELYELEPHTAGAMQQQGPATVTPAAFVPVRHRPCPRRVC